MSGIVTIQSGAPFTVLNGASRVANALGYSRPDIGNPNAPINSFAVISLPSDRLFCATGYRNPFTNGNKCVTPADVHWVQGSGPPNSSTVGRNTLRAGGVNNFDLSVSKSFEIGEKGRLEFRCDAFNALNLRQFTQIPSVRSLGSDSLFLNRDFTDDGNRSDDGYRSIWLQLKLSF
jgi:hypothetical protein